MMVLKQLTTLFSSSNNPASEPSPQPVDMVSHSDVFDTQKDVLLLRSGQKIALPTLKKMDNFGISPTQYCSVVQTDGTLLPLDASVMRKLLAQDDEAPAPIVTPSVTKSKVRGISAPLLQPLEAPAPQTAPLEPSLPKTGVVKPADRLSLLQQLSLPRVLVLEHNVFSQRRIARILTHTGFKDLQIRPCFFPNMAIHLLEKYQPQAILIDETWLEPFFPFDLVHFYQAINTLYTPDNPPTLSILIRRQLVLQGLDLYEEAFNFPVTCLVKPLHRLLLKEHLYHLLQQGAQALQQTFNAMGQLGPQKHLAQINEIPKIKTKA
jgi:hypothetical protein